MKYLRGFGKASKNCLVCDNASFLLVSQIFRVPFDSLDLINTVKYFISCLWPGPGACCIPPRTRISNSNLICGWVNKP